MLSIQDLDSCNNDGENIANEKAILKLGGINGLEKSLETNFAKGLNINNSEDLVSRQERYGKNEFPAPDPKTWISMFIESFEDTTVIVLCVAALVSLAVGITEDYAKGSNKGWIEGAAILSAVLLVAVVTATNNYNKETQFRKLNDVKDDVDVVVVRNGAVQRINCKDLVVGDICTMEAGDKVPADLILISGSDVSTNESALTGEPEDVRKSSLPVAQGGDPFLISGSTLSSGTCTGLVIAVGANSRWGKSKSKLEKDSPDTPLQEKLETLANQIGYFGMAVAACTFIAMVYVWYANPESRVEGHGLTDVVLEAFIMAVTIVVVAVPEGLPLAVTLSLAYSTQKMMDDNNLIRVLAACETMGNATNICSDKTGTLTENRMTVVQCWLAGSFYSKLPKAIELPRELNALLVEGISCNSTANLIVADGAMTVQGSKTEGALLVFITAVFGSSYAAVRKDGFDPARGDQLFTFSSARKKMSVLLLNRSDAQPRTRRGNSEPENASTGVLYTKGASESVLERCTHVINRAGKAVIIDASTREQLSACIDEMARSSLRTIAVAHRMVDAYNGRDGADSLENQLVLDGLFGIKDPLRADVPSAVSKCQAAGIFVRMVTGDNIETAKAIARECGILTEGGMALEGPVFRKLTPAQLDDILPKLQVLARSSPDDKHLLVTRLNGNAMHMPQDQSEWEILHKGRNWAKEKDLLLPGYKDEWEASRKAHGGVGEVVGVTGDGTNDGPALKAADVGLSMGLSGTDVAKEASDIVIMDDNFSSIVKAVIWGRSVFDNIRKFLQFQLTVNIVALTITFCAALTRHDPPLNAVMMLWVNLIMDTMGALALGTEPPGDHLLSRKPLKRDASLISAPMARNILVQSVFQIAMLAYLLLLSPVDFNCVAGSTHHYTIIFNTFVLCQVVNEFNARSIGNDFDVFRGLHKNFTFIAIIVFTLVAQFGIVQFGGDFVKTVPLTRFEWKRCALLASLTLPVGGLMRLIPARESPNNFASLPAILQNKANSSLAAAAASETSDALTMTMVVWMFLVALVPGLVYTEFNQQWSVHFVSFVAFLVDIQTRSGTPSSIKLALGALVSLLDGLDGPGLSNGGFPNITI